MLSALLLVLVIVMTDTSFIRMLSCKYFACFKVGIFVILIQSHIDMVDKKVPKMQDKVDCTKDHIYRSLPIIVCCYNMELCIKMAN